MHPVNHDAQPQSPTEYSLDLDALLGPSASGGSSPTIPPTPLPDRIESEDIDGPTDFTQNLTYWLKSRALPQKKQAEAKEENGRQEQAADSLEHTAKGQDDLQENDSQTDDDASEQPMHGTMLPEEAPLNGFEEGSALEEEDHVSARDYAQVQQGSPSRRTSLSLEDHARMLTDMNAIHDIEPATPSKESDTTPRASSATIHNTDLQPTVEDYVDTPSRMLTPSRILTPSRSVPMQREPTPLTKVQTAESESGNEASELRQELQKRNAEADATIKRLEEQLAATRKELEETRAEADRDVDHAEELYRDSLDEQNQVNEKEKQQLRAQLEEMENEVQSANASWESRLKTAKMDHDANLSALREQQKHEMARVAQDHAAGLDKVRAEAEEKADEEIKWWKHRANELRDAVAKADEIDSSFNLPNEDSVDEDALSDTIAQLRTRIANLEKEVATAHQGEQSAKESLSQARSDSESLVSQLSTTQNDLSSTLADAQSARRSAQEALSAKDAELEAAHRQKDHFKDVQHKLDIQISNLHNQTATLRSQLTQTRGELDATQQDTWHAKQQANVSANAQAEVIADERQKAQEAIREQQRAETRADELLERLKAAQREIALVKKDGNEKVTEIRSKAEHAVKKVGKMLEEEREATSKAEKNAAMLREQLESAKTDTTSIDNLRSELSTVKEQLAQSKTETESARHEIAMLEEDYEAVNKALDARIAKKLKEKEVEFNQRLRVMNKERKQLGRALMHEWGGEECGKEVPQGYRYKFV